MQQGRAIPWDLSPTDSHVPQETTVDRVQAALPGNGFLSHHSLSYHFNYITYLAYNPSLKCVVSSVLGDGESWGKSVESNKTKLDLATELWSSKGSKRQKSGVMI